VIGFLLTISPIAVFTIFGFRSIVVDFWEHRLPNELTIKLALYLIGSQILISLILSEWSRWLPMTQTVISLCGIYFILYVLSRNSLGFGDVKFAIPCAMTIGWYSPGLWLNYLWITFGGAALSVVILWLVGRANRSSSIAFGPYMYLGVIIVATSAVLSG
jgi:leader peptidase (prepilin peptidase)/N-methyltransferase